MKVAEEQAKITLPTSKSNETHYSSHLMCYMNLFALRHSKYVLAAETEVIDLKHMPVFFYFSNRNQLRNKKNFGGLYKEV